jgi:hypothetical protein
MSHSVKNQSWQQSATSDSKAETAQDDAQKAADGENGKTTVETGASVPSWTFKIEGKLLQVRDSTVSRAQLHDICISPY